MKTVAVTVYTFEELDEKAKEKARDWWRASLDYPWFDEGLGSIRAFVESFGASVSDYSVGERGRDYIKTDITQDHFRGRKLRDFSPDHMPTGYCLDCALWGTFHKEWERTSDPMYAFEQALEAALSDIAEDVEYQYTDEAVDECLNINDYEFTQDGRIYR
jgi:hypothetical protein